MPTYEYACKSCGEHVEVVQSFKDEALTECPACGGPLRKVFGSIGIAFKGSGFYKTDSRSSSSSSAPKKDKEKGASRRRLPASSSSSTVGHRPSRTAGRHRSRSPGHRLVLGHQELFERGRLIGGARRRDRGHRRLGLLRVARCGGPGDGIDAVRRPVRAADGRGGRRAHVAFLPRHGPGHVVSPARINARANLWALRSLGVRRLLGPCAVGSLRADLGPGDLVVLDQLVDRTWGRADTFLADPVVEHVAFADPYCPELRAAVIGGGVAGRPSVGAGHDRGVIQGPRFSTRAESEWFAGAGFDVVGMTQYPEAYLARELGLCYAGLALVTDRDAGVEDDPTHPPVTMEAVLAVLASNAAATQELLARVIPTIPAAGVAACGCRPAGRRRWPWRHSRPWSARTT